MKSRPVHGYSLIELMVALAIGLVILVVLLTLAVNSSSSSKSNQRTADLQTTGRYALDLLKREVREAGVRGFSLAPPNAPTTALTPVTLECLESGASAGNFVGNIGQGIWGADDSNPFVANCLPAANYLQGDILVIRKTGPSAEAPSAGAFYFRSNYAAGEIFHGIQTSPCPSPVSGYSTPYNTAPCISGNPGVDLKDYPVREYVYYISPSTSALQSVPALWRLSLQQSSDSAPGSFVPELVASGVEQMQLQYQRAQTDGSYLWSDAGSITGNSYSNPTAWNDVRAVRIWLLMRAQSVEPGYTNTTTYTMGNKNWSVNDGYRRQLFFTVANLRGVL